MPAEGILDALEAIGAGGLIAAAAMIAWRILAQRADRIRGRRAAGDMLGTELTVIAETIKKFDWNRQPTRAAYEQRIVPRDVYVGLAGSARLADFGPELREFLYRFYWRASVGDHAYMNSAVGDAIKGVERFAADNAPGARAALGRLGRYLGRRRDRRGGKSECEDKGREPGQSATGAPLGGGAPPSAGDAGSTAGQSATGAPLGGGT